VLPVENDTDSESLTPASTFASTPLVGVIEPAFSGRGTVLWSA